MRTFGMMALVSCVSISVGATSPAPACTDVTAKTYGDADLKHYPPKPLHPKSDAWAKAREDSGSVYFVAEYCPDGKLQSLVKRQNRKVQSRYEFDYLGEKLFGIRHTDENGNVHLLPGK